MKLIITGSRYITDTEYIEEAMMYSGFEEYASLLEIVSSMDNIIEKAAYDFSRKRRFFFHPLKVNWVRDDVNARYVNNFEKGDFSHALLAIWDGECPYTKHMIDYAQSRDLFVYVHMVDNKENIKKFKARNNFPSYEKQENTIE